MKIKCFGIVRDIVGVELLSMEGLTSKCVGDLRVELHEQYPELKELSQLMIAINLEYAQDDQIIQAQDEIAIIPPVSGG